MATAIALVLRIYINRLQSPEGIISFPFKKYLLFLYIAEFILVLLQGMSAPVVCATKL
jgi:hypothetical protein